tara:strand:- start:182 stop:1423 length:1242 start_codon:yes stop_codon:yes gene_type:complete
MEKKTGESMKKIGFGGKFGKYNGDELNFVKKFFNSENKKDKSINWVIEFENSFKKITTHKYAIAINSATSGLHTALKAIGVKKGDEVISPGITVVMDAFATIMCDATPVFVDVEKDSFNLDMKDLLKKVTKKTKAIITVSLFGLPCDYDKIIKFAKKRKIIVIDDSAETLHGFYKKKFSGSQSDIAVYSFENKKHISAGSEGGMLTTSNKNLAKKMRKFAGIGYANLTADSNKSAIKSKNFQNPNYKRHDTIGLNYRMNQISAAVGLAQLRRSKFLVNRRIEVAKIFLNEISECKWLVPQKTNYEYKHSYYSLALKIEKFKNFNFSWEKFYNQYKKFGGDGFYASWVCPFNEPAISKYLKLNRIKKDKYFCPNSTDLQKRIILIKTNYRNLNEAKYQAKLLKKTIKFLESNIG